MSMSTQHTLEPDLPEAVEHLERRENGTQLLYRTNFAHFTSS